MIIDSKRAQQSEIIPISEQKGPSETLHRGLLVSLAESKKSVDFIADDFVGEKDAEVNSTVSAEIPDVDSEDKLTANDFSDMLSMISEKGREIESRIGDTKTSKSDEEILDRRVTMLTDYYAKEEVDFSALTESEQMIAAQNFAATATDAILEAMGIVPAPAIDRGPKYEFEPYTKPELTDPAEQPSPASNDDAISFFDTEMESDISDDDWDETIDLILKETLAFAGTDEATYKRMPMKVQDAIDKQGLQQFLKYSGLDQKGLSSLPGPEYVELVRQYAGTFSRVEPENVEHVESQSSAPVVEEVATQSESTKQPEAKTIDRRRSVDALPPIFVSGSSEQIELDESTYHALTEQYGRKSLRAPHVIHAFRNQSSEKAQPEKSGLMGGVWKLLGR